MDRDSEGLSCRRVIVPAGQTCAQADMFSIPARMPKEGISNVVVQTPSAEGSCVATGSPMQRLELGLVKSD